MNEELKPCPFCGSEPVVSKRVDKKGNLVCIKISCSKPLFCSAELSRWFFWNEIEEAYDTWNRRAGEDD